MESLSARDLAWSWIKLAENKLSTALIKVFLLGIAGGAFVALGGQGFLVVTKTLGASFDPGFASLMGALVFPTGIFMVIVAGGELYTGNCLSSMAVFAGTRKFSRLVLNLGFVFLGNALGAIIIAAMVAASGISDAALSEKAISIATAKLSYSFDSAVLRGILCNILVAVSVWMQAASKSLGAKLGALYFPVMLFVLTGFDHSVANCFYFPLAIFLGADLSLVDILVKNIIPVLIGNAIGGALFLPGLYYLIYVRGQKA